MPMTSDEHAELLMRQNNRHLLRRSLISNLIFLLLLLVVSYAIFTAVIQNDSNPNAQLFLTAGVVLLVLLALNRLFFRVFRRRELRWDDHDVKHLSK